jgi:hypothetical protein
MVVVVVEVSTLYRWWLLHTGRETNPAAKERVLLTVCVVWHIRLLARSLFPFFCVSLRPVLSLARFVLGCMFLSVGTEVLLPRTTVGERRSYFDLNPRKRSIPTLTRRTSLSVVA